MKFSDKGRDRLDLLNREAAEDEYLWFVLDDCKRFSYLVEQHHLESGHDLIDAIEDGVNFCFLGKENHLNAPINADLPGLVEDIVKVLAETWEYGPQLVSYMRNVSAVELPPFLSAAQLDDLAPEQQARYHVDPRSFLREAGSTLINLTDDVVVVNF